MRRKSSIPWLLIALHIINLSLKLDGGQLVSLSLKIIDYATFFYFYNVVENEARFVSECLLYNFIKDKFQSLFEKEILGSLKSFFQLIDH